MKKFILLPLLLGLLASCDSQEANLIKDYEQTIGNTKIDLSMKIKKLTHDKVLTGKDSVGYFYETEYTDALIDSLRKAISDYEGTIKRYSDSVTSFKEKIEIEKNEKKPKDYMINYYQKLINIYSDTESIESSLKVFRKYYAYAQNGDKPLGNLWTCTYTIKNPILGTKNEVTNTYLFNVDNTKILSRTGNDDDY